MAGSVLQGEGFSVSFSNREVTAWGGCFSALKQVTLDVDSTVITRNGGTYRGRAD